MEPLLTSTQMQACDRAAIRKLKIPGILLMENAGRGVVDLVGKNFGPVKGRSFLIFCGKGNNAGDGFVAARHLILRGAKVSVLLLSSPDEFKNDTRTNYKILERLASLNQTACKLIPVTSPKFITMLPEHDFIIDAIFGTGFSGDVRGSYREMITRLNNRREIKIAIDLPSGLDTNTGIAGGVAVQANATFTICFKKTGLILGKAKDYTGNIEVVDIGYSAGTFWDKCEAQRVQTGDIKKSLPHRPFDVHKHNVGKIFVIAGSRGMTGAAAMVSLSAMRAGAGAVILGTPESVYPILAKKLTEVMVTPLWETSGGSLSSTALDQMKTHIAWSDLVVIGPGLSVQPDTVELVRHIVKTIPKPMLIDADGLNAFTDHPALLQKHASKEIIITPHTGELSRITGIPAAEIETNRLAIAKQYAKRLGVTVVLKGAPTITAATDGNAFVNSTGNAGMATAGSGDILSGLISGLWGQRMTPVEAAYSGVFLHGLSGDLAIVNLGEKSLMAMDLFENLPGAFQFVEQNG